MQYQRMTAHAVSLFLLTTLTAHSSFSLAQSILNIQDTFVPSGWMGDGEFGNRYIQFSESDRRAPHSPPSSIRITYTFGPNKWAGIYWQNQPNNWGDNPGTNYANKKISRISFWAKGETGTEVVEFKSGGIDNKQKPYRDSYTATTGRVTLGSAWRRFVIDLSGKDLSSVIGVFCWVATKAANPSPAITFQIDDIVLE